MVFYLKKKDGTVSLQTAENALVITMAKTKVDVHVKTERYCLLCDHAMQGRIVPWKILVSTVISINKETSDVTVLISLPRMNKEIIFF